MSNFIKIDKFLGKANKKSTVQLNLDGALRLRGWQPGGRWPPIKEIDDDQSFDFTQQAGVTCLDERCMVGQVLL